MGAMQRLIDQVEVTKPDLQLTYLFILHQHTERWQKNKRKYGSLMLHYWSACRRPKVCVSKKRCLWPRLLNPWPWKCYQCHVDTVIRNC